MLKTTILKHSTTLPYETGLRCNNISLQAMVKEGHKKCKSAKNCHFQATRSPKADCGDRKPRKNLNFFDKTFTFPGASCFLRPICHFHLFTASLRNNFGLRLCNLRPTPLLLNGGRVVGFLPGYDNCGLHHSKDHPPRIRRLDAGDPFPTLPEEKAKTLKGGRGYLFSRQQIKSQKHVSEYLPPLWSQRLSYGRPLKGGQLEKQKMERNPQVYFKRCHRCELY